MTTTRSSPYPIEPFFLSRWSPRAMSGEAIDERELFTLFEAARWAPSGSNVQPWRFLYARRDTPHWPVFFDLLMPGNQEWCHAAAALVVFISRTTHEQTGRPILTHAYDTGAAWMSVALQGHLRGLVVHGMGGFNRDAARASLAIPEEFAINAMAAVGRPGPIEALPEAVRQRETPSDRRPLSETVHEGPFRTPSA